MKVEHAWLRDEVPITQQVITPPRAVERIHLLRGGRWLLCLTFDGELMYCDLDEDTHELRPFVRPLPDIPDDCYCFMSVEEDLATPLLSFNVAIACTLRSDGKNPDSDFPRRSVIEVWHAVLVLDEDNKGVGFRAEFLGRVPLSDYIGQSYHYVSLLGPHIAYDVEVPPERKAYALIFDWTNVTGRCVRKTIPFKRNLLRSSYVSWLHVGFSHRSPISSPFCACFLETVYSCFIVNTLKSTIIR